MTLGSLFDGSGGFPLGGLLAGIQPIWASEIEPFPIRVTTKRMPFMKHYGDVIKMHGDAVEPVDIITFGSPCQDMSIAGKRGGLDGKRSGLFHEAVRIIKEMRGATDGQFPRFCVWENVPGAFSSNSGEDFRCVLEAICRVKATVSVPRPERWTKAGEIVGDGFSIAWRVLDACGWGVPQRRKRIYLVADFNGGCAGQILFASEGVSGYSAARFRAWQSTAGTAATGTRTAGDCLWCVNDQGGTRMDISEGVTNTLRAEGHHPPLVFENHAQDGRFTGPHLVAQTVLATFGTGGNNQPFVVETPKALKIRCGREGGRKGALIQNDQSATLGCQNDQTLFVPTVYGICSKHSNAMLSNNPHSGFYEAKSSRTLDTSDQSPCKNQGGMVVVEGNGSRPSHQEDGYSVGDTIYTLNTVETHSIAMPVYSTNKNSFHATAETDVAGTLVATDYKEPPTVTQEPYYLVRRLTPQECARLQGFPDWWCDDLGTNHPTETEIEQWQGIWDAWNAINGKKPKSRNQVIRWIKNPYSDSAAYKLWGNGVALPCVFFVLAGIAYYAQSERT